VAVIRNTRQMLWDTTIPDFIKWYPDGEAGILEKTNSKFQLKFDDVECEVLFRGLDDANDVRRLLSLQLTFGVMDEFITPPDLLIYLRASVPSLVTNIQKRGREYEEAIRLDYLTRLNERYEAWATTYTKGKLLIIDIDNN
jgi:hypothetical protein